jgi:hypothetical protein
MWFKTFFYLQTMLMGFLVDKHIFLVFWYIIFAAKTMTTLWIYIEIKSLDESSIKLGNKSFWVLLKEMVNKLKDIKRFK